MKRLMSTILCLTMLFVMASVPALAAVGEGQWVELLNEDFSSYKVGDSFDVERTYENAKSYIYYPDTPSSNVTLAVSDDKGDKALKIGKEGTGDKRILFKLTKARAGQVEISFKMLATEIISGAMNVEVFADDNKTAITGTQITINSAGQLFNTHYNGTLNARDNDITEQENYLTANTWVDVKYSINTGNGDVEATYKYGTTTITRTITEATWSSGHVDSLSAVSGLCIRLKSSSVCDLYIDDIKIKYYEEPAFEEPEFDFSNISSESINSVTKALNLIDEFKDEDGKLWYISWISGNNEVINDETGAVTPGTTDERVKLTAIFTDSGTGGPTEVSFSKSFDVKVLAAGTYHLKEGFDAAGDYSGLNAIASYPGGSEWNIGDNYGDTNQADSPDSPLNANISTDPENSQDKVLKLHRTGSGTTQRVWTRITDKSEFNEKMYVGMRVLRDTNGAHTDIYANAADGRKLMRVRFGTDGTITYQYGEGLGEEGTSSIIAPSGKWFDFTIELDMKNGTYNSYIDGQSIKTEALPMSVSGSSFGGLTFDVHRKATEECIIYFDDLTMRTTDGMPYSIAEYNFTDADNNYPTRSMVEGGYLKSVTMRKMSAVDAGSEPTLYVCFFKGDLLYDVISAPIDENSALGGFDVTLNQALPEKPLDYTVKAFVFSKNLVPLMNPSTYEPFPIVPTIFVAGDSLAKSYSVVDYPVTGYGQVLSENFDKNINIENHAEGSRSSKTFIGEGRLAKILDNMYCGDYLFIQFGHNDRVEERYTDPEGDKNTEGSFKYYLMQYINGARAKGATPVLITPPGSNHFDDDGGLYDADVMKYVEPMRELAQEEDVLLVDLYADWKEFVDNRPVVNGSKIDSRNYYMYLYSDDIRFVNDEVFKASKYHEDNIATEKDHKTLFPYYFDEYPERSVHADSAHLNAYTARVAAKFIAKRLKEFNIGLSENIIETEEPIWPWNGYESFGEKTHARN